MPRSRTCRAPGDGASAAHATAVDVRMCVRPGPRRTGQIMEMARGVAKLETEGLAKRDITLNVGRQHDVTSGHGWAISERRPSRL